MPNKETSVAVSLRGQMHSLTLKNPVMTASGTFGYGWQFEGFYDVALPSAALSSKACPCSPGKAIPLRASLKRPVAC